MNIHTFFCFALIGFSWTAFTNDSNIFEAKVDAWRKSIKKQSINDELQFSSEMNIRTGEFYEVVEIGIQNISRLIEMRNADHSLTVFLPVITKIYAENYFDKRQNAFVWSDYPSFTYIPQHLWVSLKIKNQKNFWTCWWEEGRALTPEIFARKYDAYIKAKSDGKKDEIKKNYTLLQNMGIVILPNLLEKIESGEKDLIPMFSYLTDGKVKENATPEDCKKYWDKNKDDYAQLLDFPKNAKK